jgi:hypothetical protein
MHGPLNVKYINYWQGFQERVWTTVKKIFGAPQQGRTSEKIFTLNWKD